MYKVYALALNRKSCTVLLLGFWEKAMLQEIMFAMDMSVCVDYEMAWVADYWRCFNNGEERDICSILGPHDRSLSTYFKTPEFQILEMRKISS